MEGNQPAERHTGPRNRLLRIGLTLAGFAVTILIISFLATVVLIANSMNEILPGDPHSISKATVDMSLAFTINAAAFSLAVPLGVVAIGLIVPGLVSAIRNQKSADGSNSD